RIAACVGKNHFDEASIHVVKRRRFSRKRLLQLRLHRFGHFTPDWTLANTLEIVERLVERSLGKTAKGGPIFGIEHVCEVRRARKSSSPLRRVLTIEPYEHRDRRRRYHVRDPRSARSASACAVARATCTRPRRTRARGVRARRCARAARRFAAFQ